jgi:hypothetical protein
VVRERLAQFKTLILTRPDPANLSQANRSRLIQVTKALIPECNNINLIKAALAINYLLNRPPPAAGRLPQ